MSTIKPTAKLGRVSIKLCLTMRLCCTVVVVLIVVVVVVGSCLTMAKLLTYKARSLEVSSCIPT